MKENSKHLSESPEKKNMKSSIGEGIFSIASGNMTQNYIVPFALAMGASNYYISIIVMLQNLGSTLAQIPGARMVGLMSRKAIWLSTHTITRFMWMTIPLLLFLPGDHIATFALMIFAIFFLNGLRNPAWSSLMADIIPQNQRGEFFGKRNMITGIAGLVAILISGLILSLFGFAALFPIAGLVGLAAIPFFLRISEPGIRKRFIYRHSFKINPKDLLFAIRFHPEFFNFTFYMIMVSFAIAIASPFYTIKMLKAMDIGYIWYAAIITIEAIFVIISQPYWGRFCTKYGDKTILIVTGIMLCFIPFWWIFASNIWMLLLVNIYDGFIYGGFTLVTFNFLLDTVPVEKKESYIANHTFLLGIGTILGTLFGGLLAALLETSPLGYAISIIFLVSFCVRACSMIMLFKLRKVTVDNNKERLNSIMVKSLIIQPTQGVHSFIDYMTDPEWVFRTARGSLLNVYRKIAYKIKIRTER